MVGEAFGFMQTAFRARQDNLVEEEASRPVEVVGEAFGFMQTAFRARRANL